MQYNDKILLVDDDPLNLDIFCEILEDNYRYKTASSGEEALQLLPEFHHDLILLDIMMPGMDGYEVCRRIRLEPRFRHVKIILVSGKTSIEERLQGYAFGADDYITKPFVDDELLAKIKVFLRLKYVEEMEQLKSDLLTLFSHETRTPISSIVGAAELLQETLELPEESQNLLQMIVNNSERLLEFVEKAKLLVKLKSGRKPDRHLASLKEYILRNLSKMEDRVLEKKITVVESVGDDLLLELDWPLIDKALEYVLDNAVKYAPEATVVEISQDVDDQSCLLKISDAGGKLKETEREKIFNEFSIEDIDHHHRGQGLSLAIVQQILASHGGEIDVSVVPGEKTTFNLKLPLQQAPIP